MMSGRSERGQLVAQLRHQREVPGGERGHPDDVHVGLDRLARHLAGRLEQRADVDVEAEVGERRGDHLLAAVVAVLAHLGDQDARPAALGLGELVDRLAGLRSTAGLGARLLRGTRRRWYGSGPACRPNTFSSASEISPTVAFARAASIASASRLPSCRARRPRRWRPRRRSAPSARRRRRARRAPRAAGAAWRAAAARTAALSTSSTSICSSAADAVLVDADHRLAAGVDARLGARGGLLDPQLRDARPRWPAAMPPAASTSCDVRPGPAGQVVGEPLDVVRCRPTGRSPAWCPTPAAAAAGCCGRCGPRSRSAARAPRRARWCAATGCGPGSRPSPRRRCGRRC